MAFLNENEWILLNEIAYNISFIYTKKAPVLFYGSFELKKAYDFRQMLFSLNIMTSYDYILPYGFLMSIVLLHIFLFFMLFLFQYTTAHLPEPFDMNIG